MSEAIERHKIELKKLREDRNIIRAGNSFVIKSTEDILKTFNLDNGSTLITFNELYLLEIGKVYDVNEDVSFVLLTKTKNKLVFTTYMQEGGSFGLQEHDCFEICKIVKGNLFETERKYTVYTEGDLVSYSPFEKHKPYATANSVYEVTFYKELP